jgi:hypothetical protein
LNFCNNKIVTAWLLYYLLIFEKGCATSTPGNPESIIKQIFPVPEILLVKLVHLTLWFAALP